MKIYLSILILSWVLIIWYLVENPVDPRTDVVPADSTEFYKKQLEYYPYDHSKITDSTLNLENEWDKKK